MKIELKYLVAVFVLFFLVLPVNAQTLSFIDTTSLDEDSGYSSTVIYVYYPNGTLAGNITSTAELAGLDSTQDLTLILKPNTITLFNNPEWVLGWVLDSWMVIFVVVFAIVIAVSAVTIAVLFTKVMFRTGGKRRGGR